MLSNSWGYLKWHATLQVKSMLSQINTPTQDYFMQNWWVGSNKGGWGGGGGGGGESPSTQ